MAPRWDALDEWRQVLSDPAVERAAARLGDIESFERLEGGGVYRAWRGQRYVEFRKLYREPAEPTLGSVTTFTLQASEIMTWPLEREPRGVSRAEFRHPRAQRRHPRRGEQDDE